MCRRLIVPLHLRVLLTRLGRLQQMQDHLPPVRPGIAAAEGARLRLQPGEARAALRHLRGGAQRPFSGGTEPVQKLIEEPLGLHLGQRDRGLAVQLQEAMDPFACLRRHLRGLHRGR